MRHLVISHRRYQTDTNSCKVDALLRRVAIPISNADRSKADNSALSHSPTPYPFLLLNKTSVIYFVFSSRCTLTPPKLIAACACLGVFYLLTVQQDLNEIQNTCTCLVNKRSFSPNSTVAFLVISVQVLAFLIGEGMRGRRIACFGRKESMCRGLAKDVE